jgi:predicted ferric reductase
LSPLKIGAMELAQTNLPSRGPLRVRPLSVLTAFILVAGAAILGLRTHAEVVMRDGTWAAGLILAGKIAGLLAAMLLMIQFALSARLKLLDGAFGLDRLLRIHRYFGASAGVLACLHPVLLYSTGIYPLGTFRWTLWPEFFGGIVLSLLFVIVTTSLWRQFLLLSFESWRKIHQLAFAAAAIATLHALARGSDLAALWVRLIWLAVFGGYAALFVWVKVVKPRQLLSRPFTVRAVKQLNHNVCRIELAAPPGTEFRHFPGQFAFLRFRGRAIAPEEHPFTISSSPSADEHLSFTIKASGDFTKTVPNAKDGDAATVDGPYGRFSHVLRAKPDEELLLIAGGVGITPFLSMLHFLADTQPERPVTLTWANRTQQDIFAEDELEKMQQNMPNLLVHHILSHEPDWPGETGFVDGEKLRRLFGERLERSRVFLCGPPPMMVLVSAALRKLGVSRRRIHTERFSL